MTRMIAIIALVALTFGLLIWVRLAPLDADRLHADPLTRTSPGSRGVLVHPDPSTADIVAPVLAGGGLAQLEDAIMATPRAKILAGSFDDGWVTVITRTLVLGFPDAMSLRRTEDGTSFAILSRSIYGGYDWGTNRKRVEGWLAQIDD